MAFAFSHARIAGTEQTAKAAVEKLLLDRHQRTTSLFQALR
jgi:hypothetical protein